ncbi:TPA: hypothetical protein DCE37_25905 [Candidatus Latescibacteria bacterium]|nr:hypothetical protein [Candidatus Latescibacterota bacterium]
MLELDLRAHTDAVADLPVDERDEAVLIERVLATLVVFELVIQLAADGYASDGALDVRFVIRTTRQLGPFVFLGNR